MIRGIFCHDLPVYKDKDGVYCSTTLTDTLFSRYLSVVDELIVATRVYSLSITYEEAHQEKITLLNIKFIDIPNLNKFSAIWKLIPKYKRVIEETVRKCDLIFIRGGIIGLLGTKAAWKYKKPYLSECCGCAFESYWNYSFSGKLIAPFMEYYARKTVKKAQFVIYVTKEWLQKRYPPQGEWTYASNVILKNLDEGALVKRLKKISSFDGKTIILGTTAGLNKMKGQQYVIKAMKMLGEKFNIKYELVGSGDDAYLKRLAQKCGLSDNVIFLGQMNHDEVLSWLDSIDIYVQPSLQEGLPRSLVEAMSRACPAIGSHTAGIPELLHPSCVFPQKNVKALSDAITMLMDKKQLYENAKSNYEKASDYELYKLENRIKKIYHEYREFVIGGEK